MSVGDWIVTAIAIPMWIWLFVQILSPRGFIDEKPRWCTGCQRHFVKRGCPVHDEERRKRAA